MFHQLLTPVGDSLTLSFLVAILPVATVLILLGVVRRPAWQAALAGLIVGLIIAVAVWGLPAQIAFAAASNGAVFALWPVMWIVISALFVYNIAVSSGRFDAFRAWIVKHLPNDRRVVLVVIAFCFGALLEGIAGFGTPVAITSSLLIMCGFPALDAIVFVLIFNTTPVAFGALGTPVTVLGAVTGLPAHDLGQMIGRQLPLMAVILPFYVMALYGGWRSIRALWPVLAVAGLSFGLAQFGVSNFLDYTLTDVLAALVSLAMTLLFLRVWRPAPDPQFAIAQSASESKDTLARNVPAWQGWMPWLVITVVVILWTYFKVAPMFAHAIPWPGLDKAVSITLYNNKPYAAVWSFQPLSTGTAILVSALIVALLVRMPISELAQCAVRTIRQIWQAVMTVMFIVALAYVMNYSGLAYTIGLAVSSTGHLLYCSRPSSGGWQCFCPAAIPRATPCSEICKWLPPASSA